MLRFGSMDQGAHRAGSLLAGLILLIACAQAVAQPSPETDLFDNPARCAFRMHRLTAAIDPNGAKLTARDEILLVHPPAVPARMAVPFLLHRDLTIQAIRAMHDKREVAVRWEKRERWEPRDFWENPEYPGLAEFDHAQEITLALAKGKTWPDSLWVTIEYSGTVYDSLRPPPENYQRGFETTGGLIDPRGAYLSGQTLWYPQRFDAGFPFRLTAITPVDWRSVSQGRMLPEAAGTPAPSGAPALPGVSAGSASTSGRATIWDSPEPMDEIYLIAGPYVLRSDTHNGVELETFTYGNDDEELCRRYLDATREYLDLYGELIGPYPFAKFALVENFWQTGYGMPSFTLLGDRVIRLPFIVKTSYGHEILHNWWGNSVFVDAEQGNWCEGLTAYGADYLYKERESADAAREYRRTQLQGYLDYVNQGHDFALTEFRERNDASSAAIGYGKSMMIDHMLRRRLGDEAFWGCLREFYTTYRFRAAAWGDFIAIFAARGGFDAARFHAQWIARPGAPVLALAATDLTFRSDGSCDLRYRLAQAEPVYDLHVPVRLSFADRPAETWLVELDGTAYEETRHLAAKPLSLEVDPDFDLCRRLHRAEVPAAFSQLFGADSVTIVLAAAEAPATPSQAGIAADSLTGAWRAIADEARRSQPAGVVSDAEIVLPDLREGGTWLFGEPRWMERVRERLPRALVLERDGFRIGEQRYDRATHTLAFAIPNPEARDQALGVLLGQDAAALADVWRKLPHYGSYSYLVFEGTRNVAKGTWPVERSPLKVVWDEGR